MAVEILSLTCPKCGASLSVASDREVLFCEFCGQKIYVSDSNHPKHTYRKIDDARIREAEARERVRLKELELEEKKMNQKAKEEKAFWKGWIILMCICFGLLLVMSLFE